MAKAPKTLPTITDARVKRLHNAVVAYMSDAKAYFASLAELEAATQDQPPATVVIGNGYIVEPMQPPCVLDDPRTCDDVVWMSAALEIAAHVESVGGRAAKVMRLAREIFDTLGSMSEGLPGQIVGGANDGMDVPPSWYMPPRPGAMANVMTDDRAKAVKAWAAAYERSI